MAGGGGCPEWDERAGEEIVTGPDFVCDTAATGDDEQKVAIGLDQRFLAGFNERWTNVILGKAEQTIAGSLGEASSERRRHRDDDEDGD